MRKISEELNRMRAMIQTIRGMTSGGKLALILSSLWVFSLAACGYGGGCIPGCGAKLPTPRPPQVKPPTRIVKITLTEYHIKMPHVLPPGPTLFKIINRGNLAHYLEIQRQGTEIMYGLNLMPGDTKELKLTLEPSLYRVWSPFNRDEAKGMKVVVTVTPSHAPAYP
jgi:hypothetical protein